MIWVRIVALGAAPAYMIFWAIVTWVTQDRTPVDLDAVGWVDREGQLRGAAPGGVRKRYIPAGTRYRRRAVAR